MKGAIFREDIKSGFFYVLDNRGLNKGCLCVYKLHYSDNCDVILLILLCAVIKQLVKRIQEKL